MLNAGSPYGPSKAALEALSAIMAKDLDGTGVTVNVLVPGGITNTPMVSIGFDRAKMIQPEVMVPPLLWLVSDPPGKYGRRFLGSIGTRSPPEQAAEKAGAPLPTAAACTAPPYHRSVACAGKAGDAWQPRTPRRNAMPTQIGENRAKKMLKANELVLCMGVNQLRTPNIAMIAAACGFDAVYIDLEHNPTSLETAAGVCVAALGMGITPIARVTSHDPHDATRILDCGAQGVMVPHVQNAAEARAIVEACLYAPKGHRSAFGSGPQLGYAAIPQAEVCKVLNEQTLLMAMIETPEAVENADAIAAVDGIDVLHIGASDLSTEMGIPGQYTHERMRAAFETVARAAKGHGKAMGVGGVRQDFEFQSWLLRLGVRYLTGGSDVGYILSAGRADVKQLRELKL